MFSRQVSLRLKPNTREEFIQTLEREIIPLLRKQKGFRDEIAFVAADRGTEVIAYSLWEKKEDAEAYHRGSYPEVQKMLAKVVDGTVEVRNFEVANSTFHNIAARVAA